MKRLFLSVSGEDKISLASVDFTTELVATIRARKKLRDSIAETGDSLDDIRFFDGSCDWFYVAQEALLTDEQIDGLSVELLDSEHDGGTARTECDRMCVGERGVEWSCYQKHGDAPMLTETLTYEDLERFATEAGIGTVVP